MARLSNTVREQIADCASASYKSLTVTAAQKMMMFDSAAELGGYLQSNRVRTSLDMYAVVRTHSIMNSRAPGCSIVLRAQHVHYRSPPPKIIVFLCLQPDWTVQNGVIHFGAAEGQHAVPTGKRADVDPQQLIANALHYAVEIERIV